MHVGCTQRGKVKVNTTAEQLNRGKGFICCRRRGKAWEQCRRTGWTASSEHGIFQTTESARWWHWTARKVVMGFWSYIRTLACVLHLHRVLYDAVKARITKLHCSYLLCGCAAVSSRVPGGCFAGCVLHFPPLSLPTEVALRCPVCHSSLRISQGKAFFRTPWCGGWSWKISAVAQTQQLSDEQETNRWAVRWRGDRRQGAGAALSRRKTPPTPSPVPLGGNWRSIDSYASVSVLCFTFPLH